MFRSLGDGLELNICLAQGPTTTPMLAMPKGGDVPDIPMFMVTQARTVDICPTWKWIPPKDRGVWSPNLWQPHVKCARLTRLRKASAKVHHMPVAMVSSQRRRHSAMQACLECGSFFWLWFLESRAMGKARLWAKTWRCGFRGWCCVGPRRLGRWGSPEAFWANHFFGQLNPTKVWQWELGMGI